MIAYVVDASVAAKWYLPADDEPHKQEALALLGDYTAGLIEIVFPDVFWVEFGNILWKAARRGRISRQTAEESVAELANFEIPSVGCKTLLKEALTIANTFDRTVYDASYVALAAALGVVLVTADERLANALAARFPIRWLGAYVGSQ